MVRFFFIDFVIKAEMSVEILTAPFIPNETSKGKEVEAPMLEFRLAWKGRYQLLEEAGLLAGPPGKMFRCEVIYSDEMDASCSTFTNHFC